MRLTVIGATGRTGRHVLAEAARRGHHITAFSRRPDALDGAPVAEVVTGDGRSPDDVRRALAGADAVVSIVSAPQRTGPHVTDEVTGVILDAMREVGVRRLVTTGAYPAVATRPRIPVAILKRLLAAAYADQAATERRLAASDVDWTMVRLNRLTDGPAVGEPLLSTGQLAKPSSLARADAAAVLLDLAADGRHLRAAVNVAGRTARSSDSS